jgi:hypothetical protein
MKARHLDVVQGVADAIEGLEEVVVEELLRVGAHARAVALDGD